jgi:hypothetical protein
LRKYLPSPPTSVAKSETALPTPQLVRGFCPTANAGPAEAVVSAIAATGYLLMLLRPRRTAPAPIQKGGDECAASPEGLVCPHGRGDTTRRPRGY